MPEVITHQDLRAQSDADIARLTLAGSRSAFGELIARHGAAVRTHLRRMGAQGADADDMAQEAFIIAYQRLDEFRFEGPILNWFKVIASRRYLKKLKSSQKYLFVEDMSVYEPPQPDETPAVSRGDIDAALSRLKPIERLCVSLNFSAGCNHSEIASETGLPLGTVKSHIRRGLEKLRQSLSEGEGSGEGHAAPSPKRSEYGS